MHKGFYYHVTYDTPNKGKNIKILHIFSTKIVFKIFIQTLNLIQKMKHEEEIRVHILHF